MAFYILSFGYVGPKSNFGCGESDKALSEANGKVETVLTGNGYNWRHAYCWTDGTLHKFISTDKPPTVGDAAFLHDEISKAIKESATADGVWIRSVAGINDSYDPHKPGYDTVKEFFEKTE